MRGNGKGCILMLVTDLSRFQGKQNRLLQKILLDAKELSQKSSKKIFLGVIHKVGKQFYSKMINSFIFSGCLIKSFQQLFGLIDLFLAVWCSVSDEP